MIAVTEKGEEEEEEKEGERVEEDSLPDYVNVYLMGECRLQSDHLY